MTLQLSSPVTDIPRIGPAKAKYLQKLDITHVRDFLYTFPRRYDDFSNITPIADLKAEELMTVRGTVKSVNTSYGFQGRRRILRIFVDIQDDSGTITVTWFNLHFLPRQLWQGREIAIAGKVELNVSKNKKAPSPIGQPAVTDGQPKYRMRSPIIEFTNQEEDATHTGRITPVYPETYGVSSRFLRYNVKNNLYLIDAIPEYLPKNIRQRQKLIGIHHAIKTVHFPANAKELEEARLRLRFDELFFLQLAALVRRQEREQEPSHPIKTVAAANRKFIATLPFILTNAQQNAVDEIVRDLKKGVPMNRLLQGDVGSGKSAVALIAINAVVVAGRQVLYLAPTEILARQQAEHFKEMLGVDIVDLLVGSSTRRAREKVQQRLEKKGPFCLVGTHALLQEKVNTPHIALAIIDEQHRFGVKQRQAIQQTATKYTPHLLSMTATPIPRTLNLTLFGDLDISVLDELPKGRRPIKTAIISSQKRNEVILKMLDELHAGRQGYVISPLVTESTKLQVKSAEETLIEMRAYFPDIAIELLHGKLKAETKKGIMENFAAGAIQLLVATSVVEVGVNIPNATCMIIEGAQRFGLSQLHQFRGRIGRGEHQSYCYLFPSADEMSNNPRLKALASTTDGFVIAEKDLELRGPGDLYGTAQSGYADLKVASLLDYPTIKKARIEAEKILKKDPQLKKHDILRRKVQQKNLQTHFE